MNSGHEQPTEHEQPTGHEQPTEHGDTGHGNWAAWFKDLALPPAWLALGLLGAIALAVLLTDATARRVGGAPEEPEPQTQRKPPKPPTRKGGASTAPQPATRR